MNQNRAMVVDDEPGVLQLCKRLLGKAGFEVSTFDNPKNGLQQLEQERFDLLLADIRMPVMDGFEMMEHARRIQPDLATVIMTGFGTLETAIQALHRGSDSLVLKPFTGKELVQTVQQALEQSQHKQDVLRLQALRPLFTISETLFSETNPERLQELVLEAICGHLKSMFAAYVQRDFKGNWKIAGYHLNLSYGPAFEERLTREKIHEILTAFTPIVERVSAANVPLVENFSTLSSVKAGESQVEPGFGPVVCSPASVKPNGNQNQFLLVARASGDKAYSESDLEMLIILARQAAVALENAQLHAELRAYIRQLEESQLALIQAEKMAIAGRLTASIAHEINNPLQAVRNCLHLAGRKELSLVEQQNYLSLAQEELERLMGTVQRMLDFYRPGALDRKPTDLHLLIRRVLALLEKQCSDHKIQVRLNLTQDLPSVYVVGDQIQQVLLNLLLNSIEAMPEGGDLFIETLLNQEKVEVMVCDTGPGVSASQKQSIFEPFYSTKQGGTGLGLAISYGIITAHNGILELVDSPRSGACFRISLKIGEN